MLLLALLPSSFLLGANSPALWHTPRAVVTAHHGHEDHSPNDKFDTSIMWSEPSWDQGYSLGKYSRTRLVEAYGLDAATEPDHVFQALTNSISEYSRESLAARDAWLDWLPKLSNHPLLEKLAIALGLKDRDEWLEGCLLEAGDDEAKRGVCMA